MARDYYTLEPDRMYRLGHHFTSGRGGAGIEFITRHHLMYIGGVKAVVDNIWNTRQASAHVVVDPVGEWGQAVYDRDTAWANANAWANARTIAIEHSNNTGRFGGNDYHDKSWNISDETLVSGARVAAAYCKHERLGRPVFGGNIRDHNFFTSTGCPVHLQGPRAGNAWGGKAGKYHYPWMEEATWFFDQLDKKLVLPDGTPIVPKFPAPAPPPKEDIMAADLNTLIKVKSGKEHRARDLIEWTDDRVYEMTRAGGTLDQIKTNQERIEGKLDRLLGEKEK
ncbi:N-acetylmuramoyl-L-alanine amidase [Dietzia maris]|uniref:N-acetylmuramoyl-L-alanine amidase n=1 Tax=Dietzia maris TaxID=37915 RepID=UPI0037C95B09